MRDAIDRFKIRQRRVRHTISKSRSLRPRLVVFRSNRHVYAQIIDSDGSVLTCASTLDKELRLQNKSNCNKETARQVGTLLADRVSALGIPTTVVYDRGGYKYHGIVKSLADAARQKLEF